MKAWHLCSIAIVSVSLIGCQTNPVELPLWDDLEYASTDVVSPTVLPARPAPESSDQHTVSYDAAGFDILISYMDVSDANYDVAVALALALQAQAVAYNHLIDAGKMQRQIAVIRAELLQEERTGRTVDRIFYQGIIVLGLLAAL